jgi:hypothetical protein
VPGSGKTSTVLILCQEDWAKEKKILMLTYNSKLKEEVRLKKDELGLKNLEVHSYHSLYYKYYSKECSIDAGISRCL